MRNALQAEGLTVNLISVLHDKNFVAGRVLKSIQRHRKHSSVQCKAQHWPRMYGSPTMEGRRNCLQMHLRYKACVPNITVSWNVCMQGGEKNGARTLANLNYLQYLKNNPGRQNY